MYSDYIILEDHSSQALQMQVNERLKNGYIPLGGVATAGDYACSRYCQAMAKYEKKES